MRQVTEAPTLEAMRAELKTILASNCLRRAPALSSFLTFICEEYFNGRADQLKEYTIAVDALGRPNTFQPNDNPIVRVQATRLRDCLKDYYRGEGKRHPIQIRLPKGQYCPEFHFVGTALANETPASELLSVEAPAPDPASQGESERLHRRKLITVVAGTGIATLAIAIALLQFHRQTASIPSSLAYRPAVAALDGEAVRILAGNATPQYIDEMGRTWSGDRYFKGGRAEETVYQPVVRVDDGNLWRHFRGGDAFQYDIPLRSGTYELHLYFVEPVYGVDPIAGGGETARLFDVFANERPILASFDILGDTGGARTTDEKVFKDISPASDGALHLRFASHTSEALVNAIELLPAPLHSMRPIRITTRNMKYSAHDGVLWDPDHYYSGGRIHPIEQQATGANEVGLYSTERFGNFNYTFPVADGSYTAVLYFSEAYHGPSNPGGGGAGSRVFDVYFNGVALLKDFDIYQQAGGPNRALRREFHGLKPNAQGKLVFAFQPIRNYACVNAIEILPE